MKKHVFLCKFLQETDTFTPVLMRTEEFVTRDAAGVPIGELIDGTTDVGGAAGVLSKTDWEIECGVLMRARSGGVLAKETVQWFMDRTIPRLQGKQWDGVVVLLHGASVSEVSNDVCGDILTRIRETVGEKTVIAASFDLHANVTEATMRAANFVSGYQTYPHLDQNGTGRRAAELLRRKLEGEDLKTYYVSLPMIAPPSAYTTTKGELKALMERGFDLCRSGALADFSVFQAQPWLDVPKLGATVVVVGKDDEALRRIAAELAKKEFDLREELQGEPLPPIRDVIGRALANKADKPVVLGDSADSPNAGATGDCATVIGELLPYADRLSAALAVTDPPAVAEAFKVGVGNRGDFTLGASLAPQLSEPVRVEQALVKSLHLGKFTLAGPAHRKEIYDVGRAAVLQVGKLEILVVENGHTEGDLQFYRGFGIDPALCDFVQVKACTSFRAPYTPVAAEICVAATPGAANPDLKALPFLKRPKPLYPFEEITEAAIPAPKRYR